MNSVIYKTKTSTCIKKKAKRFARKSGQTMIVFRNADDPTGVHFRTLCQVANEAGYDYLYINYVESGGIRYPSKPLVKLIERKRVRKYA